MLKVEIEKKELNSWDWNNSIKIEKINKIQFPNNLILNDETKKKWIKKRTKKNKTESNWINLPYL